jgi:hypothetical protein
MALQTPLLSIAVGAPAVGITTTTSGLTLTPPVAIGGNTLLSVAVDNQTIRINPLTNSLEVIGLFELKQEVHHLRHRVKQLEEQSGCKCHHSHC